MNYSPHAPMTEFIHQHKDWPHFRWDPQVVQPYLTSVHRKQGRLKAYMQFLGFKLRDDSTLQNLTMDVLKSSEIEGENFDREQVRSSVARHLGMDTGGIDKQDRYVDGVVEMMLDATQHFGKRLTKERLFGWHAALFPTGRSAMEKIPVGKWRTGKKGPMQVVSGRIGKEKVHFVAPDASKVSKEMNVFLKWFNGKNEQDHVIKSAIAHFWFVTIHPFTDGNGRIARALADMQLAKADGDSQRYYSMSAQIREQRKNYYETLEKCQRGKPDITAWITWYLACLDKALDVSERSLQHILKRTRFWDEHAKTEINERQRKVINKLFEGFEGALNTSKWAKLTKSSPDTALRDIQDLLKKKILKKEKGGGRSTSYSLR